MMRKNNRRKRSVVSQQRSEAHWQLRVAS